MKTKFFYDTYRGEDYYIYTLENEHLTVGITDFGAAIQFIKSAVWILPSASIVLKNALQAEHLPAAQ